MRPAVPQLGSHASREARFSLDDVLAAGAAAGLDADRAISAWMSAHLPGMLQQLRPPHAFLLMEQP